MADLAQISAGTRRLLPDQQRACAQQSVVNRPTHVTALAEEIQHEAVDREQSLRLRSRFEPRICLGICRSEEGVAVVARP